MNALLEFLIVSGVGFFFFMFLGYKDATRTKAPKGLLANLFNNLSFWKAEDKKGIRGYLFRQNILLKLVVALVGAAILRLIYAFFFDYSIATETFHLFNGISAYLMTAGIILAGIYLSYMWPAVTERVIKAKDDVIKDRKEKAAEVETLEEPSTTEVKEQPQKDIATPKPPKKDDPNDIINDYLN